MKKPSLSGKSMVFFDFDNTITSFDVFDQMVEKFSVSDRWRQLEKKWQEGKIGSKECLEGQLRGVRVTKEALSRYLSEIPIDPHFKQLFNFLKKKKIPVAVVSDNFSFLVEAILRNNGITQIPLYANRIRFLKGRLLPSFPYQSKSCSRCAHCKKQHLLHHKDKTLFFVGDGLSDVCPAEEADWVFAKGSLRDYLNQNQKPCIPFEHLGDVHDYLLNSKNGSSSKNS